MSPTPDDLLIDTTLSVQKAQRDATRVFMETARGLPSVFDLAENELRLLDLLEQVYGDDPNPNDPEAVQQHEDAVNALSMEFAGNEQLVVRKVESYLHMLAHLRMLTEHRKAHAARLRAKAEVTEHSEAYLKERLMAAMQLMERPRIDTPIGTVRIQQNPPRVVVLEELLVPSHFKEIRTSVHIDLDGIKRYVKETGEVPPGVSIQRGQHLRTT